MIDLLFAGVAVVLLLAAGYWVRGRGGHRPTGTWAMAGLLVSFALAFGSYVSVVENAVESVVPEVGRLLSNSFTLAAATSVLAFMLQLDLEPAEAARRIRRRVLFLGVSVAAMTVLFTASRLNDDSPQLYALYVLIYITYLGVTAKDFGRQTWKQAGHSRRRSQRVGLRVTAVGCAFALLYAAYKVFGLISIGLELNLLPHGVRCSTPVSPVRCVFSVTAPALAVLLITLGLTLPAVVWPFSQFLRRRWEARSFTALAILWKDITDATPEVVLTSPGPHGSAAYSEEQPAEDSDFVLHRRVIEINDGVLALRPHRSARVQGSAARAVAARGLAGTPEGDAIVEAAILRAAVHAKMSGSEPRTQAAPPASRTASRAGDLRAETEWLLLVAEAYAQNGIAHAPTDPIPSAPIPSAPDEPALDELTPSGTDPHA
ncbi:MAB_1171c family putative transporter [Streptomyces phaeolivaceus]|uniref:MAB_1171c family putative transporter n=1 Tax=Streptomyces phaeolivaceus TaxID=2653200 RepID=UPI00186AB68B|nr:MAB_1171c family putative transporter [Streptomyces phaeolivaceus]